jgi:hypothetical protein
VELYEGKSEVGINRRGKNKQGQMLMIPNANAPFDERVWVLKLIPTNGGAPALVFSYACHPVIVYGFAYAAISPDFPGVVQRVLREALGAKAYAQFVQGFAGKIRRER